MNLSRVAQISQSRNCEMTIIHDATVAFCRHFLDPCSPAVDQMIQAARGARQNIAEISRASTAPTQTELRLVKGARASLDELLLDFEDFLRQRNLRQWTKDDPEAVAVRAVGKSSRESDQSNPSFYNTWLTSIHPATVANAIICLIHQAKDILDQQIQNQERTLIESGASTENPATARLPKRTSPSDQSIPSGPIPGAPSCPRCGKPMSLRTAKTGGRRGSQFWGCSLYPACKGTRPI